MSKEIDSKITQFMRQELNKGHFEHTLREIAEGTELSYNDVVKGVERLNTRGLIRFRSRGSDKKSVPYYYLSELRDRVADKSLNAGKRDIKLNARKQNPKVAEKEEAS